MSESRLKPLAVVAALIAYGSLYPFDFEIPRQFDRTVHDFLVDWRLWTSRGDVLGNVGLFVLYGLAGVWAAGLTVRRRAAAVTLGSGMALALLLQIAQLWVRSRSALLADVFWNTIGVGLGIAAAAMFGASRRRASVPFELLRSAAVVLAAIWLLAELAPLVPALDFEGIKRSLRPLVRSARVDLPALFYRAAQVLLLFRLAVEVVGWTRVFGRVVAGLALVLGAKVVIVQQFVDWTTVLGFAAGSSGWWLLVTASRRSIVRSEILLALLIAAYALQALAPFVRGAPTPFSWLPFATSLDGAMLPNLRALAAAAFTLGGCVWLMRDLGWPVLRSSAALAALVLALELGQIWIQGRTPSSTEPVLVLLVGWALARPAHGHVVVPSDVAARRGKLGGRAV
jgi:hypothetical protein